MKWHQVNYSVPHGFMMKQKKILSKINVILTRGTISALIGPNGAGKSTSLKIGAGLILPDSGRVTIRDKASSEKNVKKEIGFLSEIQTPYKHLTIEEWLLFLGGLSGISRQAILKKITYLSVRLGFKDLRKRKMGTLSKGQHQRAGLAQALLHDPSILLLDEPMSGLDPAWRDKFQEIMMEFVQNGGTILFSSHVISDVDRLADQVVMIDRGRIIWQGNTSELSGNISEYEVVLSSVFDEKALLNTATPRKTSRSGSRLICNVDSKNKEIMIELASQGTITIEAINPVYIYRNVMAETLKTKEK